MNWKSENEFDIGVAVAMMSVFFLHYPDLLNASSTSQQDVNIDVNARAISGNQKRTQDSKS
jgi:hypothetical protein